MTNDVQTPELVAKRDTLMRGTKTVKAIRTTRDHTGKECQIIADLTIGRGWQSGNGFIDYYNMGWREYDKYLTEQHDKEVQAKKDAENERVRAELEAMKKAEEARKAEEAKRAAEEEKKKEKK